MILIDPPNAAGRGRLWSHLASDTSYDELHVFARAVGIPERGFDREGVGLVVVVPALNLRAGRRHDMRGGARSIERAARLREFHLFEAVGDEDGDLEVSQCGGWHELSFGGDEKR